MPGFTTCEDGDERSIQSSCNLPAICIDINSASLVVCRRIPIAENLQKRPEPARSFRRLHGDATRRHSLVELPRVNHVDGRLVSLVVARRRSASGFSPGRSQPTAGRSRIEERIHQHAFDKKRVSEAPLTLRQGFQAPRFWLEECAWAPPGPRQHGPYYPHPFPARSLAMCCLTRHAT